MLLFLISYLYTQTSTVVFGLGLFLNSNSWDNSTQLLFICVIAAVESWKLKLNYNDQHKSDDRPIVSFRT